MNQTIDKNDIYKEVFMVLSNFNDDVIKKIPNSVFNKIIDLAADSEIKVNIDATKPLEEQNISEESKNILSLIYYKYIANNDEKKELIKLWDSNDKL